MIIFPSVTWHHINIKHSHFLPSLTADITIGTWHKLDRHGSSPYAQTALQTAQTWNSSLKPVWVASTAHSVNKGLLGGTLWGYPRLLSCWIASRHGAALLATVGTGFDETQLQALVLPVKPPQFPHSKTVGGKKRWLCLCPPRSRRNGDECLDGVLSYEKPKLHLCGNFLLFDPVGHKQGDTIGNEQGRHVGTEFTLTAPFWSILPPSIISWIYIYIYISFLAECFQGNKVSKRLVFGEATAVETPKPVSTLTCSLRFLIINHEASGQTAERWWKVDGQSSQTHGVFFSTFSTSVIWCSISQASMLNESATLSNVFPKPLLFLGLGWGGGESGWWGPETLLTCS